MRGTSKRTIWWSVRINHTSFFTVYRLLGRTMSLLFDLIRLTFLCLIEHCHICSISLYPVTGFRHTDEWIIFGETTFRWMLEIGRQKTFYRQLRLMMDLIWRWQPFMLRIMRLQTPLPLHKQWAVTVTLHLLEDVALDYVMWNCNKKGAVESQVMWWQNK